MKEVKEMKLEHWFRRNYYGFTHNNGQFIRIEESCNVRNEPVLVYLHAGTDEYHEDGEICRMDKTIVQMDKSFVLAFIDCLQAVSERMVWRHDKEK